MLTGTVRPQVAIDKDLEARGIDITFQYDAFYDLSRESGLSRREVEEYQIRYLDIDSNVLGRHRTLTGVSTIYVPTCVDEAVTEHHASNVEGETEASKEAFVSALINIVTVHELGHYIERPPRAARRHVIATNKISISTFIGAPLLLLPMPMLLKASLAGASLTANVGKILQHQINRDPGAGEEFAHDFEERFAPKYEIARVALAPEFFETLE